MPIPPEFADYLNTTEALTREEQEERAARMYTDEILTRAKMMRDLNFERSTTVGRIKRNFEWAFEFGEHPACLKAVDGLVDGIYAKYKPKF